MHHQGDMNPSLSNKLFGRITYNRSLAETNCLNLGIILSYKNLKLRTLQYFMLKLESMQKCDI